MLHTLMIMSDLEVDRIGKAAPSIGETSWWLSSTVARVIVGYLEDQMAVIGSGERRQSCALRTANLDPDCHIHSCSGWSRLPSLATPESDQVHKAPDCLLSLLLLTIWTASSMVEPSYNTFRVKWAMSGFVWSRFESVRVGTKRTMLLLSLWENFLCYFGTLWDKKSMWQKVGWLKKHFFRWCHFLPLMSEEKSETTVESPIQADSARHDFSCQ